MSQREDEFCEIWAEGLASWESLVGLLWGGREKKGR